MAGLAKRWEIVLAALVLLPAGTGAYAQSPTYKCVVHGEVEYSQTLCPGARELGKSTRHRVNVRYAAPPQDRAVAARRAPLSDEAKHECQHLDVQMPEMEAQLKSKGAAATLEDEMPLVFSKKRYRELGC